MTYPPEKHQERDLEIITGVMRAHPFAHFFTSVDGGEGPGPRVTRLPFALDVDAGGAPAVLRAHLNRRNPQMDGLDGADALVAFSGPHSFVSPNWRTNRKRAGTWDYQAVHVWGRVRVREERAFFAALIDDLAAPAEAAHRGVSDAPPWAMADADPDYVDRLFPHLAPFEVVVTKVEAISKLHQDFPEADALSVADHLDRSPDADARATGALVRKRAHER